MHPESLASTMILQEIRRITGKSKISRQMRLYHDLWISGDDALELLNNIKEEFRTDLSTMLFEDYFEIEPWSMFVHIGRIFGFPSRRRDLTVDHLIKVVERGQWFEPKESGTAPP